MRKLRLYEHPDVAALVLTHEVDERDGTVIWSWYPCETIHGWDYRTDDEVEIDGVCYHLVVYDIIRTDDVRGNYLYAEAA